MSNLILDRPTSIRTEDLRPATSPEVPATVGSYVDTDGVRRAPVWTGSYTGTPSAVGAYTGRRSRVVGSYVRTER